MTSPSLAMPETGGKTGPPRLERNHTIFGNHIPYSDYLAAFSQTRIPVTWPNAVPNLQPRDDIWPTDKAPVICRREDGTNEFIELRCGFPPAQPKRPPVINFPSEGRKFPKGRCLV